MRLDARDPNSGAYGWNVYHAEHCCMLPYVVWADDGTHQYGEYVLPITIAGEIRTVQAKKIQMMPDIRLIIINPIADSESTDTAEKKIESMAA